MRYPPPRLFASLVLGACLVAPAHAAGEKDKSPEDVFKAFAAAMKKDDLKAMMSHMTRDSQSASAATMVGVALWDDVFFGFMNDRVTPKQKEEHSAVIREVLSRHGLSEDALRKKLGKDYKEPTTEEERTRLLLAGAELVKDKPAFVTEIRDVCTGVQRLTDEFKEIGEAKLKEVKIDGQQAKAQVTFPRARGKDNKGTVYFKLENGIWKIDLVETNRNWPPPPQVQPQVQPQAPPSYSRPGLLRRLFQRLRGR